MRAKKCASRLALSSMLWLACVATILASHASLVTTWVGRWPIPANRQGMSVLCGLLADGEGFEPSRRLRVCPFSRPVPSTTRPPIHRNNFKWLVPSSLATNRELQPDCNRQRSYQRSRGIPNSPPIAFAAAASAPLNKCRSGPGLRSPGHDKVGDYWSACKSPHRSALQHEIVG